MKITKEQILKGTGFEIGDKIKIDGIKCELNEKLIFVSECGRECALADLVNERIDFEIIEDKIWDIDKIEDEKVYFVEPNMCIDWFDYGNKYAFQKDILETGLGFKKREYAEEYRQELLNFNEEYKRKNRW